MFYIMKIRMLKVILVLFFTLTISQVFAYNTADSLRSLEEVNTSKTDSMKPKITVGEHIFVETLHDNPISSDFIQLLPLTAKLDDYANTEKIFYPSRKLSVESAPDVIVLAPVESFNLLKLKHSDRKQ